jgi:hypothetical protein
MRPILAELAHLPSARQIAAELNRRGIKSATGGQWFSKTVTRLRERPTRSEQDARVGFARTGRAGVKTSNSEKDQTCTSEKKARPR